MLQYVVDAELLKAVMGENIEIKSVSDLMMNVIISYPEIVDMK